jgi:hypothetical protein
MIEKQLNKVEESQRFFRAIGFGNNQELIGEDIEAIEIGELSRRLIKNSIICWNYLYLTKRVLGEKNKARRHVMLRDVSLSSILHWQHLNFLGEYDFSKKKRKDSVGLQGTSLLKTNIVKMWNEGQTVLQ